VPWYNEGSVERTSYTCGYCGHGVANDKGYFLRSNGSVRIIICPFCEGPTHFDKDGAQFPGVAYGSEVSDVPSSVNSLYDEARNAMSVNAYTAAVMACRKVLMNVAVDQSADENKPFAWYVDWLAENGFLPPKSRESWVDRIRDKGNEANHEIKLMSRTEAEEIVSFTEMLLRFVYEFPAKAGEAPPSATAQ
jgi:hypothetical protein